MLPDAVPTSTRATESERKQVTALFADLSGYTALAERLDPEDLKEITTRILADISNVISRYDGFTEKYVGDAVLALFGVPLAHEDDAYRAVRAAIEIRDVVMRFASEVPGAEGVRLQVHTGLQTGLVVTGHVDLASGTHGVTGDTLNVASRLSGEAGPGEILVGDVTHGLTEVRVEFEGLPAVSVKGKVELIPVHRVIGIKAEQSSVHRVTGRRARLVGRDTEIERLREAARALQQGRGSVVTIRGEAGTGKSRLVEELKTSLDLETVQWHEAHAFPFAQGTAYSFVVELLSRALHITESDSPRTVAFKVDHGIEGLEDEWGGIRPYVGSLFAIDYPELANVSPEVWKQRLLAALCTIVTALARQAVTILFFEDLHWADTSSLEILRTLLCEVHEPVLILCAYRPPFALDTLVSSDDLIHPHIPVELGDLPTHDAERMVELLLGTTSAPANVLAFLAARAEGNPFFLEEILNNLVDTQTLVQRNGTWELSRPLETVDIPATVQGVIASRVDRLEPDVKRVLHEASVIGRVFAEPLLAEVCTVPEAVPRSLRLLERADILSVREGAGRTEWVFRHALTHETVYNSLLRKERREAHERIGLAIERAFPDRLAEFYEVLAYHFESSDTPLRAVDYLVKSGQKTWGRFALAESHQHFRRAYDILTAIEQRTPGEDTLMIDVLNEWAIVYNHRGDYTTLSELLARHESLVDRVTAKEKTALTLGWLGYALLCHEQLAPSYDYLRRGLALGQESGDPEVIAYLLAWLTRTCAEMGRFREAVGYGARAKEYLAQFPEDDVLLRFTMSAIGITQYFRGDVAATDEVARALVDEGRRTNNVRTIALGLVNAGCARLTAGQFSQATELFEEASNTAVDPMYKHYAKLMLGLSLAAADRLHDAEGPLTEVIEYDEKYGFEAVGSTAQGMLGIVLLARGQLAEGVRIAEEVMERYRANGALWRSTLQQHTLGKIYLKLVQRAGPRSTSYLLRNLPFLLRNLPRARSKAERHFRLAAESAEAIEAVALHGQVLLDLGRLYQNTGRRNRARDVLEQARALFAQCGAKAYLEIVEDALVDAVATSATH